jgi:hypothetical protein
MAKMHKNIQFICRVFLYCCIIATTVYMIVVMTLHDKYDLSEQKYRFIMLYSVIVLINILLVVAFDTVLFNVNMDRITHQMANQYETVNLRLYIQIICLGIASLITFIIVNSYELGDLPHLSLYIAFHSTIACCLTLFILQHRIIGNIIHIVFIVIKTVETVLYEIMVPYYKFDVVNNRREPSPLQSATQNMNDQTTTENHPIIVNQLSSTDDDNPDENECKICFTSNTIIVILNCKHTICIDCAKSWLSKKKSCPFCRTTNLSVEPQTDIIMQETSVI